MTETSGNVFRKLSPFPTVGDTGDLTDGIYYSQPRVCSKCKEKECRRVSIDTLHESVRHKCCPRGLSTYQVNIDNHVIVVNGMIDGFLNQACPRDLRKSLRSNKTTEERIERWRNALLRLESQIAAQAHEETVQALAGLHDIKAATSIIFRNAETLLEEIEGRTYEEKIAGASKVLRSLLYSVDLLRTRLSFPSIVVNPESASFGQKRPHGVYQLFDRMQRLFNETADRRHVGITMSGTSFKKVKAYDSLEVLALVLVDNAVKYSAEGKSVGITVNDESRGIRVRVETFGSLVPSKEQGLIFERGYRTASAKKLSSSGSGLGLYAAQVIAKAHGSKITYSAVPTSGKADVGRNIFELFLEE